MLTPIQLGAIAGKALKFDYSQLKYGIDISHHNVDNQPPTDWQQVKDVGILNKLGPPTPVEFVYIKLTEGSKGRDKQAIPNAQGAAAVGLPIGFYHFCTLDRKDEVADAMEEAHYLMGRIIELPAFHMPIALDIELENKTIKLDQSEVLNWANTFYAELNKHGFGDHVIYSYSPFLHKTLPKNHNLGLERLWLADYNGDFILPPGWTKVWMHQYSATGKVAGIHTPVDLNRIL